MIRISPMISELAPFPSLFGSFAFRKSFEPTTARPMMMMKIPSHWKPFNLRLSTKRVRIPVNTIRAPRSIWNEEAVVRPRPKYIMVVAVMSSAAGMKKIKLRRGETGDKLECQKMSDNVRKCLGEFVATVLRIEIVSFYDIGQLFVWDV